MCGEVPIPISDFSSNSLLVPQPVQLWLNVVVAEGDKDDDDDFISTPRSRLLGKRVESSGRMTCSLKGAHLNRLRRDC